MYARDKKIIKQKTLIPIQLSIKYIYTLDGLHTIDYLCC